MIYIIYYTSSSKHSMSPVNEGRAILEEAMPIGTGLVNPHTVKGIGKICFVLICSDALLKGDKWTETKSKDKINAPPPHKKTPHPCNHYMLSRGQVQGCGKGQVVKVKVLLSLGQGLRCYFFSICVI